MNYEGQLYGNAGGIYIPLTMTTHAVDQMEKDLDEIREIINPDFSDEQLVVEVKRMKLQEEADEIHEKADACLIAAAPDTYGACKSVMDAIDGHSDWSPDPEVDNDTWNPDAHINITLTVVECRQLKAAIAKAEGRAE